MTHQLDSLSREEIVARLSDLRKQFPQAYVDAEYKVVDDAKNREGAVEFLEVETAEENAPPTD